MRDARWLIQTAQGPLTRHVRPYFIKADKCRHRSPTQTASRFTRRAPCWPAATCGRSSGTFPAHGLGLRRSSTPRADTQLEFDGHGIARPRPGPVAGRVQRGVRAAGQRRAAGVGGCDPPGPVRRSRAASDTSGSARAIDHDRRSLRRSRPHRRGTLHSNGRGRIASAWRGTASLSDARRSRCCKTAVRSTLRTPPTRRSASFMGSARTSSRTWS